MPMPRRTWVYLQDPNVYGMAPCPCGNTETQWSEFEKHLWCDKCQKDFIPEHGGIFDGPILVNTCSMLGISFDRFNLETKNVERFNAETGDWKAEETEE